MPTGIRGGPAAPPRLFRPGLADGEGTARHRRPGPAGDAGDGSELPWAPSCRSPAPFAGPIRWSPPRFPGRHGGNHIRPRRLFISTTCPRWSN